MSHRTNVQAIILAAGRSSRFKTTKTKLSFMICGQEMILFPVKVLQKLSIPITIVVGYQKEVVKEIVSREHPTTLFVEQTEQRGTGHAVMCTQPGWFAENILVMNGDCPLINEAIIQELIDKHLSNNAAFSFVTSHNGDPTLTGYGRVIREGSIVSVVEQRDFTGDPMSECCINAGIYLIKRSFLEANLPLVPVHKESGELFLPELIRMASSQGLPVETTHVPFDTVRGINTLKELWTAEHIKRSELIAHWMSQGVHFSTAQNVHLDLDVSIGSGTFIGLGTILLKGTSIGTNCFIDAFSLIKNSTLADNVTIKTHCAIYDSVISANAQVGPFAHIRNASTLEENSCVGNFVEVSASTIGSQSKAKHLSYIGNTSVGEHVNIGAGTITCNYNGFTKNETIIEDGCFIGSNTVLIAPVTIGKKAITAAGSTITENVPEDALAIARERQINKEGYASIIRERYSKRCTDCKKDYQSSNEIV